MNRITAANLILVDINYLWEVGDGYLESIMELKTNINNIYSINLLSTLAVELLAKTIIAANICLENKDKEENEIFAKIDSIFRDKGHKLDELLKTREIEDKLEIEFIKKSDDKSFRDEYVIKVKNLNDVLILKTLEAARYATFSRRKDAIIIYQDKRIYEFMEKLSGVAKRKIDDVRLALMK
ncbi:MAG: hypothetical protein A2Y82_04100 [Candidatus Buchananbacteria bacterium RBG_13_36_9]|uniref:Uncharacterized protein n=1 Tax=Candidatus Buchananbacteria bacterium RBG_13_36_9 TaxID=1797530 RepID=A0A1G1XR05_9BACT|nr:MAG: hypothetical protein A2Y82_04100 [Candidatus Buchananbacteria bacterium RBG_13_36_9]